MIIPSSVSPVTFACSKILSSMRHQGFELAWKILADKRPASFISMSDFMQGTREAFTFFNEKLSSERSLLKDVTSNELWQMIQEMPASKSLKDSLSDAPSSSVLRSVSPSSPSSDSPSDPFLQTEAFVTALSLPSSFPPPVPGDSATEARPSEAAEVEESGEPLSLGVRVKFYSQVSGGGRRIDELEFESQWDGTKGLGEWKIISVR